MIRSLSGRTFSADDAPRDARAARRIRSSWPAPIGVWVASFRCHGSTVPVVRRSSPPTAGRTRESFVGAPPRWFAAGVTMAQLTLSLSRQVRATVVDQTELAGAFDVELQWDAQRPAAATGRCGGRSTHASQWIRCRSWTVRPFLPPSKSSSGSSWTPGELLSKSS